MTGQHANHRVSAWAVGLIFMSLLALAGCHVKFVADYDAATYEEILRVGKEVDKFYGLLLETPENSRGYKNYSVKYVELETSIRSLYVRNLSRPRNIESTKIIKIILEQWLVVKEQHRDKNRDTYSTANAELDRGRFQRLFVSAVTAEEAKKSALGDTGPDKDNK